MIAKRVLDFVSHRANFLKGTNFTYSAPQSLQQFLSLESFEQNTYKNKNEKEDSRKNNEENENERDYNNDQSKQFNWLLPSAAVLLSYMYVHDERKRDIAACFFGSKTEKVEVISCLPPWSHLSSLA